MILSKNIIDISDTLTPIEVERLVFNNFQSVRSTEIV